MEGHGKDYYQKDRSTIKIGDLTVFESTLYGVGVQNLLNYVSGEDASRITDLGDGAKIISCSPGYYLMVYISSVQRDQEVDEFKSSFVPDWKAFGSYEMPKYCGKFDLNGEYYSILKSEMGMRNDINDEFAFKGLIVKPLEFFKANSNIKIRIIDTLKGLE